MKKRAHRLWQWWLDRFAEEVADIKCPECKGLKKVLMFGCTPDGLPTLRYWTCSRCQGSGKLIDGGNG